MNLVFQNVKHRLDKQTFAYDATIESHITGVFGPSGAGKTTFLNLIAGLQNPSSGEIRFNDDILYRKNPKREVRSYNRNIGVVFQSGCLFPHLNVEQNLLYSTKHNKTKRKFIDFETVVDILQLNNLLFKKPVKLSGGEKQRVAIGRALLSQPRLLLLDEPFSSLDHQKRKEIIRYLLKINHHYNLPMIIISHDLADILRLTKQMVIIKNGGIKSVGNYLDIAQSVLVRDIIKYNQFLNVFDAYYYSCQNCEQLCAFTPLRSEGTRLMVNSGINKKLKGHGTKVRFCIRPDDIALSNHLLNGVSIQNQLNGVIVDIIHTPQSSFVKIDCGYSFISEVTQTAINKMDLKKGNKINVLIKSKAIETVTVF